MLQLLFDNGLAEKGKSSKGGAKIFNVLCSMINVLGYGQVRQL
jgi:hypothetical protein